MRKPREVPVEGGQVPCVLGCSAGHLDAKQEEKVPSSAPRDPWAKQLVLRSHWVEWARGTVKIRRLPDGVLEVHGFGWLLSTS